MRRAHVALWIFGVSLGALLVAGCGLTAASDDELLGGSGIEPTDAGDASVDTSDDALWPCLVTEKRCDGVCVGLQANPQEFGCDKVDCSPCPSSPNTVITCANYDCAIAGCADGFGDCDADEPGCETALNTMENCGECGQSCAVGSGLGDCSTGACLVVSCESGWGDCDGDPENGCETSLSTVTDCVSCGTPCTVGPGEIPSCSKGYCDRVCDPANLLREDCNGDPTDGCETPLDTLTDCGGCGVACSRAHASATCAGGVCAIDTCDSGWGNCDGTDANGCETNIATATSHCGGCGDGCSTSHVSNRVCTSETCRPTCDNGWGDCNGPEPGDSDDGCESALDTTANCGGCGVPCSLSHASETCSAGICQISSCTNPWRNCDGNHSNGCEINTDTDVNHCSACGTLCTVGVGGSAVCSSGSCDINCDAGLGDCDGDILTGCETNINTNVSHCGGCGQACSPNNITPACTGGNCTGVCAANWGDCNSNKRSDGCETSLATITNCGGCGISCSVEHGNAACASGNCAVGTCNANWGDCDGLYTNGCEINITTHTGHCGGCAMPCELTNVQTLDCVGGLCDPQCISGYLDCNGPQPGSVDDGCEATVCP